MPQWPQRTGFAPPFLRQSRILRNAEAEAIEPSQTPHGEGMAEIRASAIPLRRLRVILWEAGGALFIKPTQLQHGVPIASYGPFRGDGEDV